MKRLKRKFEPFVSVVEPVFTEVVHRYSGRKKHHIEQLCCSVYASFGSVLRSPNGSETKPAGEPKPL